MTRSQSDVKVALERALRQWKMYAENNGDDAIDIAKSDDLEAVWFRQCEETLASLNAQEAAQGVGGFACPICGKEEPHSHSKEEQNSRRLRDAVKFWRQHNMEEDLKSVPEGTREVIKTLVCFADICLRSHRTQPQGYFVMAPREPTIIQQFAARIRAETLEECAKVCADVKTMDGVKEIFRIGAECCEQEIRQLGKRGA